MMAGGLVSVPAITLTTLVVVVTYLYRNLYHKRFKRNAHLPQLPNSLLWGHLRLFDDFTKQGKTDRHPDAMLSDMHKELGQPPVMLLDFWPISPPMVLVSSHEVAEQIAKISKEFQYSVPKAPSVERMVHLIGPNSLLFKQNDSWKVVRKRFNPGFAPNHLTTLLSCILDKTEPFLRHLDAFAKTGESFSLSLLTMNLTFDIIGAVAMDEDLNAQDLNQQGDLIRLFKDMIQTYTDDKLQLPWWLAPLAEVKRRALGKHISEHLRQIVRRKFNELQLDSSSIGSRTILALSLKEVEHLTPAILEETCDQLKTFLFAGHDTTSTLLGWMCYELSRTPRSLRAVHEELDQLFGPETEPRAIREKLLAPGGDELLGRMTYCSAVIKEILRLHPPAGSIRMTKPGTGLTVSTPQGSYNIDGTYIYINHTIIQRDRAVFGETADSFVPERWLGSSEIPVSAWRPFERGPRNCIGQELANIEARIIIALVARRYDFKKVGLGELEYDENGKTMLDDKTGQFQVKTELYSTIQVTAKPVDGMMMEVSISTSKSV